VTKVPTSTESKNRKARRTTLLASVAVLGIAVVVGGPFVLHDLNRHGWAHAAPVAEKAHEPAGFADIVAKVKPAVISVRVEIDKPQPVSLDHNALPPGSPLEKFFRDFGVPNPPRGRQVITGEGSGFFISADGYAVTNNHVVSHAQSVEVTTIDGKSYTAKVIGTDPKTDLALIKVDGQDFPHVKFAGNAPREGDWVIAIGNPYGLGGTVTAGIVSADGRDIGAGPYNDFIQIDAPINRGNSGGPAFNINGNVVGVNTAIFSPSGGSVGIGFDIPAATVKAVIAQLKETGHVTRGWLGIQEQPVTPNIAVALGMKQPQGALVDAVQPGSPADKAGIKSGDVIAAVNGVVIDNPRELARKIGEIAPGTQATLSVLRSDELKDLTVTLGTMPVEHQAQAEAAAGNRAAPADEQKLGLALAPADQVPGAGKNGVVIVTVDPNGPAANQGLQAGDIILEVGGKSVSKPSDVSSELASLRKGGVKAALMRIQSAGGALYVALPLRQA